MDDRMQVTKREDTTRIWAQLIRRVFDGRKPDQLDAIYAASQNIPALAEAFESLFKPIELNSPEAQRMKAEYSMIQRLENMPQKRPTLDPPPKKRIVRLLEDFESGNLGAWW